MCRPGGRSLHQRAARRQADPERAAEDRLLEAATWPPKHWDRETRLALIHDVARRKAARELEGNYERQHALARREQANRYSYDLAAWMAAHRGQP